MGSKVNRTVADGAKAAWTARTATAMGADHGRFGLPNQDSVGAERFTAPGVGDVLVLAVADGHGNARHFRSGRGSAMAVNTAIAVAKQHVARLGGDADGRRHVADQMVRDVVARWREAVAADLAADPLAGEEAESIDPGDPPEIPYGSTLLLTAITRDAVIFAQIGDGDILLVQGDGSCISPVRSDLRLDGTQTTSLCQPDAVSAFRVSLVRLSGTPVFAVLAMTDGYGNAQALDEWREVLGRELVALGIEHGPAWIGEQLAQWAAMCASVRGSGDDTSIALALNCAASLFLAKHGQPAPASATATVPVSFAPSASDGSPPPQCHRPSSWPGQQAGHAVLEGRSRRWAFLVIAVLVAGAIAGYLLIGASPGPAPHPRPTVTRPARRQPPPQVLPALPSLPTSPPSATPAPVASHQAARVAQPGSRGTAGGFIGIVIAWSVPTGHHHG